MGYYILNVEDYKILAFHERLPEAVKHAKDIVARGVAEEVAIAKWVRNVWIKERRWKNVYR